MDWVRRSSLPEKRKVRGRCNIYIYIRCKRLARRRIDERVEDLHIRYNWTSFRDGIGATGRCLMQIVALTEASNRDGQSTRTSLRRSHRRDWWWRTIRRGKKPRKRAPVNFYIREMKFLSRLSRNLFKLSRVFSSSSFFRAREAVMQSRRIGETQLGIDHLLRSTIISRIKGTRVRGSECRTSVRQVDYPESRSARRSRLFIVARFKFAGSIYFFFSLSFLPFFLFLFATS